MLGKKKKMKIYRLENVQIYLYINFKRVSKGPRQKYLSCNRALCSITRSRKQKIVSVKVIIEYFDAHYDNLRQRHDAGPRFQGMTRLKNSYLFYN